MDAGLSLGLGPALDISGTLHLEGGGKQGQRESVGKRISLKRLLLQGFLSDCLVYLAQWALVTPSSYQGYSSFLLELDAHVSPSMGLCHKPVADVTAPLAPFPFSICLHRRVGNTFSPSFYPQDQHNTTTE